MTTSCLRIFAVGFMLCSLVPVFKAQQTSCPGCTDQLAGIGFRMGQMDNRLTRIEQLLTSQSTEQKCPQGFELFHSSCYYFGILTIEWHQAKVACQQLGGKLAAVETYAEDQFIVKILRKLNAPGVNGYFTSGNDLVQHGTWVWDSTNQPIGAYHPWDGSQGPSQPRNSDHNVHVYWKPSGYRWHDHPATRTDCGFICEKSLPL